MTTPKLIHSYKMNQNCLPYKLDAILKRMKHMVEWTLLFSLEINSVFSEWKSNVIFYGLCIFLMMLVYYITYQVIRFLISHKLIQTLTLFVTVLFVIIGGYVYANTTGDVPIKQVFLFAFECITLFGGLLLIIMMIRSLGRKIKT